MNKTLFTLLSGAALLGGSTAFAGGFALLEQSVSTMGTAHAGTAALAEDASTIWWNPAGLMRLCGKQTVDGFHVVMPSSDYDDDGSLAFFPGAPFVPMNGNDGRNGGETALVGNSYCSCRINNCWALGLGINSPFGLVTDYDNNWKGRYQAVRSSILTININPTIAYRFNRCWSIGAGFEAMYMHAKLSNKIDFGLLGILFTQIPVFGLPQENDGFVHIKANSWGFGGNVGILYEPNECTRFGLAYRSEVKQKLEGSEKFDDLPANINQFQAIAAQFQDTRTKANITLPQSITFSAYHAFNSCWAIVGDVMWTKWDILNRLRLRFNNPYQADQILLMKWDNAWRGAIGAIYTPNNCWKLRAGVAYDQDPTPNKEYRLARLPGEDRVWLACGAGYNWSRCLHFDIAYSHLFVKTAKIDQLDEFIGAVQGLPNPAVVPTILKGGLKGKWDQHVDIISAQLVYSF